MISPQTQYNLTSAKEYFQEHLAVGDYYGENQTVAGRWMGAGAERLGLTGMVTASAFVSLCEGNHPQTGQQLTLRRNSTRWTNGRREMNRRIFYDFTISPPKSVSVVALMKDPRIVELHHGAVQVAMRELEKFAETRIRREAKNGERVTGNLVTACFMHETSRELDPLLHTHCIVFNATFDAVESRWKALHNGGMLRARRYAECVYDHELCRGLAALGYPVMHRPRTFEIATVPKRVIEVFSKRHRQINEETAKRLEREGPAECLAAVREQVAHSSRRRKLKRADADQLRADWEAQIAPDDLKQMAALGCDRSLTRQANDLIATLKFAESDLFERQAVVGEHDLLAIALAKDRGRNFALDALHEATKQRDYLRSEDGRSVICREILTLELELHRAARESHGMRAPLSVLGATIPKGASGEQARAIADIFSSTSSIIVFRGGAGTGKSFTLGSVHAGLLQEGYSPVVLAPQRQQADDLTKDGLNAQTLAGFLMAGRLEKNSVVILDEAGQVGIRQMAHLHRLVAASNARLILSGDTRQHGAVEASDALRVIERSGIRPIVLTTIRRQDPKLAESQNEKNFIRSYRSAVALAAKGDAVGSFDRLNNLGCIVETAPDDIRAQTVEKFVTESEAGRKVLLVTQTRDEVDTLNEAVRARLAHDGRIISSRVLSTYQTIDMTEAGKRDASRYEPEMRVLFLRQYGRFKKGDIALVHRADEKGLSLILNGRRSRIGYQYAHRLTLLRQRPLEVGLGDRLQCRVNLATANGQKIANGELVTVTRFLPGDGLEVESQRGERKILPADRLVVNRGYAVTSYGSQGKTVDTLVFADAGTGAATNKKQWYVTISRARRNVVVLTTSKKELRASIRRSGEKALAGDAAASLGAAAYWHRVRHEGVRHNVDQGHALAAQVSM